MKKNLAFILALAVCLTLLSGCSILGGFNQEDAERAALNYIREKYCSTVGAEVNSVKKESNNHYLISCNINQDCDFWQIAGTVKMSVYKAAGEWVVDVQKENIDYLFEENDNWYYIAVSGNRKYLIKMIAFSDDAVTLEYYSYDLGSYGGPDDYDHETTTCDLEYSGKNRCFTFEFKGDWRIYGNYIAFNEYEVGAHYEYYQSGKFTTLRPVNPDDYWWYERAKNQND